MGELAGLQRVTAIGLGASTPLPASTSAERNSCLHAAPRGSRGNVVRRLAEARTRLFRRRGHLRGGGSSSSGAFVVSVSGHFSATALSPFLILSCLNPGRSGKDRPGSVGNTGGIRFGETEGSSDRKAALRVCGRGGQRASGGLGLQPSSMAGGLGRASDGARQGASYTGKEPGQGDPERRTPGTTLDSRKRRAGGLGPHT